MINARDKGQGGEREVCDIMNALLSTILVAECLPQPAKPVFQRNQNQTAVGGSDITNPFGFCLEVKRCEVLNLNAWWKQCREASDNFGGKPFVLFRQNGKRKWRVLTEGNISFASGLFYRKMVVEISQEDFLDFAKQSMTDAIRSEPWKYSV